MQHLTGAWCALGGIDMSSQPKTPKPFFFRYLETCEDSPSNQTDKKQDEQTAKKKDD